MPLNRNHNDRARSGTDFQISNGPIAKGQDNRPFDLPDVIGLAPFTGAPVLYAIARDPDTIFTYWSVDWPAIFAEGEPRDRQVHLRVRSRDGAEETSVAVEPMAGNHYLKVSPRQSCRVEIGYYRPQDVWNSVATSDEVTMPAKSVGENVDVDLATIPFHLSFQRLIDLFRAQNGDALAEIVARLQRRAVSDADRDLLSIEEWEILRAMDLSLDDITANQRGFTTAARESVVRRRAESILGFGSSSPGGGFGGSSWG